MQHSDEGLAKGSDGWQYVDELVRNDGEPLVHKHYGDSFAETDLESGLEASGVGRVIVTGGRWPSPSPTAAPFTAESASHVSTWVRQH